jgi:hypothetical protein
MDGSMILTRDKYYGVLKYRSPIYQLEETEFFGVRVIMAKISITAGIDYEDESVMITLYIPGPVLNGYHPKLGDSIAGTMLLTGYIQNI